ncbi:hypothetical protein Ct9H90mP29_11240 [bacterium]|nr:MAG: hypothetical protein Ct9H90mP29_11240 [bacterium]
MAKKKKIFPLKKLMGLIFCVIIYWVVILGFILVGDYSNPMENRNKFF